jgi:hypothetical protein
LPPKTEDLAMTKIDTLPEDKKEIAQNSLKILKKGSTRWCSPNALCFVTINRALANEFEPEFAREIEFILVFGLHVSVVYRWSFALAAGTGPGGRLSITSEHPVAS